MTAPTPARSPRSPRCFCDPPRPQRPPAAPSVPPQSQETRLHCDPADRSIRMSRRCARYLQAMTRGRLASGAQAWLLIPVLSAVSLAPLPLRLSVPLPVFVSVSAPSPPLHVRLSASLHQGALSVPPPQALNCMLRWLEGNAHTSITKARPPARL